MTDQSVTRSLEDYYQFLASKRRTAKPRGLSSVPALNPAMFGYQAETADFLLRVGSRAAIGHLEQEERQGTQMSIFDILEAA